MSWIHKKPRVFNTTSWRCAPWQSRHCCHLPGTLGMTRRRLSCVTIAISWRIAYLRLLMFLWGIWKLKLLLTPSLTLTAFKMELVRRLRMLRRTLYAASWQVYLGDGSSALIVTEDISKTLYWKTWGFLWIQDADLLDRVQLYLLLWIINVLSYFQNG